MINNVYFSFRTQIATMNILSLKHEGNIHACEVSLINKVKQHPHLYDFNDHNYKDTSKCIQTWISISKDLGINPDRWNVCKERWRTLRDVYVRNRKSYLMGGHRRRKQKWKYFDQMNFLHPYINHRAFEAEKNAHDTRYAVFTIIRIPTACSAFQYTNVK